MFFCCQICAKNLQISKNSFEFANDNGIFLCHKCYNKKYKKE